MLGGLKGPPFFIRNSLPPHISYLNSPISYLIANRYLCPMTMHDLKPSLRLGQIINMNIGFIGVQIGFALQNSNASRILQANGADLEHLPLFWLAAPLTGMLIQPIVGHYSDGTWGRFGRRRPYIFIGAILTALALCLMPNIGGFQPYASALLMGAIIFTFADAAINVAMEPMRAMVGDKLPSGQKNLGFSIQTVLIGVGAVIGSWLPYGLQTLSEKTGWDLAGLGGDAVAAAFYVGALLLLLTLFWSIWTTREYTPKQLHAFHEDQGRPLISVAKRGLIASLWTDFKHMPQIMRDLGWVQFFSWFALFIMWVYMTPALAEHIYRQRPEDYPDAIAAAGNWVGVLFGVYSAVSAVYALFLPAIANRWGRKLTHGLSLFLGGISFLALYFIQAPIFLLIPMLGIGIAWGSILAMPYAMLSDSLTTEKMGTYLGLFNFFITLPQIICGFTAGWIIKYLFDNQPMYAIALAGILMVLASLLMIRFKENK